MKGFIIGLVVFFIAVITLSTCLWLVYLDYASPKGYVLFDSFSAQSLGEADAILEAFASQHTYDKEHYNCLDYSRDAVGFLKSRGYMAEKVIGKCNYVSGLHAWVEVSFWYEPQTGKLIQKGACCANS